MACFERAELPFFSSPKIIEFLSEPNRYPVSKRLTVAESKNYDSAYSRHVLKIKNEMA